MNNLMVQDNRNFKWPVRTMPSCKSVRRTQTILTGIELIHLLHLGQFGYSQGDNLPSAETVVICY